MHTESIRVFTGVIRGSIVGSRHEHPAQKMNKVPNELLLNAGLELMRRTGKALEKMPTSTRAMLYRTADGKTVRIRTCNDHILVVLAESADAGAKLNIEGTDFLLVVMPEIPRTKGNVVAYFIPTEVAASAARRSHAEWLASKPETKGNNRTWNIWFDDVGAKSGGFAREWAKYRLQGMSLDGSEKADDAMSSVSQSKNLGAVIAEARNRIAEAAGVPVGAVKISVALE